MFSTAEAYETGAGRRTLQDHANESLSLSLTGEILASLPLCQSRPVVSLTLPLGMEKQRMTVGSSTNAKIHVPHHTPHDRGYSDLLLKQPPCLLPNTNQPLHPKCWH